MMVFVSGLSLGPENLDKQVSLVCPILGLVVKVRTRVFNLMAPGDYSPEKAGVGGSTPSLATIYNQ
jgi:hypothetical protein